MGQHWVAKLRATLGAKLVASRAPDTLLGGCEQNYFETGGHSTGKPSWEAKLGVKTTSRPGDTLLGSHAGKPSWEAKLGSQAGKPMLSEQTPELLSEQTADLLAARSTELVWAQTTDLLSVQTAGG